MRNFARGQVRGTLVFRHGSGVVSEEACARREYEKDAILQWPYAYVTSIERPRLNYMLST